MKVSYYFAFALLLFVSMNAIGQSGRGVPTLKEQKINRRAPVPDPSPPENPVVKNEDSDAAEENEEDKADVIRIETRLVTIPVRVIDRKGRFVGGISRESFKVFEDGEEQKIEYFSNEAEPFTVVLVLDMSYSAKFRLGDIQSAAISFIDQLRPMDRVIIISFDENVHILTGPTTDRKEIYRAILRTEISTGTSLYEAVDAAMNEHLSSLEGRKAIVLFTDGVDTTSDTSSDLDNLRDAMELDALIYTIRYDTYADVQAMRNKSVVITDTSTTGTPPALPSKNGLPFPLPVPVISSPDDRGTTMEEYKHGEEYLNELSNRTGGRNLLADTLGNLNSAFSRIASELGEYYSIGYYPKNGGNGKTVRRIKVKLNLPNVAVRARESYALASNNK